MLHVRSRLVVSHPLRGHQHHQRMSSSLVFSLPDLTESETEYIKEQSQMCQRPKCLVMDDGSLVDLSSPAAMDRVFPPKTSMQNLYDCAKFVQSEYHDFLIPRKRRNRFARNMRSIPMLERTCHTLKWCGVSSHDLKQKPSLAVKKPSEILLLKKQADILRVPMWQVSLQVLRNAPLRGDDVIKYRDEAVHCLRTLGFEAEARLVGEVNLATRKALSYSDMCSLLRWPLIREWKLEDRLVGDILNFGNPVDIARNAYIMPPGSQGYVYGRYKACPIDALITIDSHLSQDVKEDQKEADDKEIARVMAQNASKLCIGLQSRMLESIGFTDVEVRSIMDDKRWSAKRKFSADDIQYTDRRYCAVMKERLSILRKDSASLGLVSASEHFNFIKNWNAKLNTMADLMIKNGDANKAPRMGVTFVSRRHPVAEYLTSYFATDSDDSKVIAGEIRVLVSQHLGVDTTLAQVEANVRLLERRGLSKAEIRSALTLLFFPTALIEDKFDEVEKETIDHNDKVMKANLCLYLVEKEFNFVGAAIGNSSSGLSVELLKAIEIARQIQAEKKQMSSSSAVAVDDDGYESDHEGDDVELFSGSLSQGPTSAAPRSTPRPPPSSSMNLGHADPFGRSVRLLSSSSTSSEYSSRIQRAFSTSSTSQNNRWLAKLIYGTKNPITQLNARMEFMKLRSQWDPDFDQDKFLEGTKHVRL